MIFVGELSDIPVGESVRVQGQVAIAVFNVVEDGLVHVHESESANAAGSAELSDSALARTGVAA